MSESACASAGPDHVTNYLMHELVTDRVMVMDHIDASRNASDKDRNITNTMDLQSPRAARKTHNKRYFLSSISVLCSLWPEEENLKRYSFVATSRAVWLKVRAVEL
jgi:hypothetical protein